MLTNNEHKVTATPKRPWNYGKLIGPKPPLQARHVWAIRTRLQLANRTRDLALFNLGIDSKLRGCDVVSLKVGDVAPHGYAVDRAMVRQRKTGHPVKFEITEQTRQAIDHYLGVTNKTSADFLFTGYRGSNVIQQAGLTWVKPRLGTVGTTGLVPFYVVMFCGGDCISSPSSCFMNLSH